MKVIENRTYEVCSLSFYADRTIISLHYERSGDEHKPSIMDVLHLQLPPNREEAEAKYPIGKQIFVTIHE